MTTPVAFRTQAAVTTFAVLVLAATGRSAAQNALPLTAPIAAPITARVDGSSAITANGRGQTPVRIALSDAVGHALGRDYHVRARIVRGNAHFEAGDGIADVVTDDHGEVVLPVVPGTKVGPLVVRLEGPSLAQDVDLSLIAVTAKPMVVGFATVGAGPVPGWIEAPDNAANGTNARRGTVSLYATGDIARNTRATAAYDTADVLQQSLTTGPFTDNPNDRPFPIYGDTSTRYDDALSQNHLYARVENGRSSAQWGEFYAQGPSGDVAGGYNILVNGFRIHAEGNALGGTAFTNSNEFSYDRRVISPTGLGIAGQTLHPNIVVGSDILLLIHLDRRTGAILSQQPLTSGADYVLDYASGLLRFVNVILPYDAEFNPQVVSVQYEFGGADARSTMVGASSSLKLTADGHSRADAWYLNGAFGSGNLNVFGQALDGRVGGSPWSFSHEHTNGFIPISQIQYGSGGDAYKAAFDTTSGPLSVALHYNNTSAGYNNPYGNYDTPGLVSLNGTATQRLASITDLEFSYLGARNQLPASFVSEAVSNNYTQAEVKLNVRPSKRLRYHVGVRTSAADSNGVINPALLFSGDAGAPTAPISSITSGLPPLLTPVAYQAGSGHAINADLGAAWQFTPRASIALSRINSLGGAVLDPYDPPQTLAEFDIDVGTKGKAFLRQLWQRASIQALAATQQSQTYAGTATSSTSFGFSQQVGNTTLESGYAVDHTAAGTDLYQAIGVRERVVVGPKLSGDAFIQTGDSLLATFAPATGSGNPYFLVLGTSLSYAEKAFHATGQIQVRTGYAGGSTFTLGAAGAISPSVSLFGSGIGSYTAGIVDSEDRFGLSFRPSHNDRYVTLATVDFSRTNLTNYNAYATNVAQLQELYRPSYRTELAGSFAYKLAGDSFFQPRTTIYGIQADQRVGARFDVSGELHESTTAPFNNGSATGLAFEAGWRVGDQIRLAGGYNFSGFADPSTAINPTHRGVYFTLSSYLDRFFGWGKDNLTK